MNNLDLGIFLTVLALLLISLPFALLWRFWRYSHPTDEERSGRLARGILRRAVLRGLVLGGLGSVLFLVPALDGERFSNLAVYACAGCCLGLACTPVSVLELLAERGDSDRAFALLAVLAAWGASWLALLQSLYLGISLEAGSLGWEILPDVIRRLGSGREIAVGALALYFALPLAALTFARVRCFSPHGWTALYLLSFLTCVTFPGLAILGIGYWLADRVEVRLWPRLVREDG